MAVKKALHAHGCRKCRIRYTDTCVTRTEDGLCAACRGGQPWQLLIDNAAPRACCVATCRLADKRDRETYALAGRSNWHICGKCRRTHPFKPTKEWL